MSVDTQSRLENAARNPQLLVRGAFFRGSTLSSAYLTIFLSMHGLTAGQIVRLEAVIFSGFWLLWEVPSGWIADKIGHARSILWSVPFAAVGYSCYGLSYTLWQFVLCELSIGVAQGLISGSEAALLHESLAATGQADQEVEWQHKLLWYQRASYAVGAIASLVVVHFWGVATAMFLDGVVIACGLPLAWRLKDVAPISRHASSFRQSCRTFMRMPRVRAAMQLSTGLALVTYFAVWLCAIYYQRAGLTIVLIGCWSFSRQIIIVGGQLLFRRWPWWRAFRSTRSQQAPYATWWWLLAAVAIATLGFGLHLAWWLVPLALIFDVTRTIAKARIDTELNRLITGQYRASLHSVHTALQRGAFMLVGMPLQLIDARYGFQATLLCSSGIGLIVALYGLVGLQQTPS